MRNKSVILEARDIRLAIELIELGARLQLLERGMEHALNFWPGQVHEKMQTEDGVEANPEIRQMTRQSAANVLLWMLLAGEPHHVLACIESVSSEFQQPACAAGQIKNLLTLNGSEPTPEETALLGIKVVPVGVPKPVGVIMAGKAVVIVT